MIKRILIVDDNDNNRKLIDVMLKGSGYETFEAINGKEALEIANQYHPDLVLMDIQMPIMDGIHATQMLKLDKKTRDIPVIALTSFAMSGDRENILNKADFKDYITKPISYDSFLEMVKKNVGA